MDGGLFFLERGCGAPLILLHGNGESHAYFEAQIAHFSAQYRVIAVDTRGHGRSPRGKRPFTLEQFARDLLELMDGLEIARAHLLGFSDGGNIALTFALAHPERVERLILNGANLFPAGLKPSVRLPIELGYRAARLRAGRSAAARGRMELLALMARAPDISPQALSSLRTPALVIAGTRDMIRTRHTRLIARSLPNARLELIPGGHFIAAQNPEAFNAAVERFLRAPLEGDANDMHERKEETPCPTQN